MSGPLATAAAQRFAAPDSDAFRNDCLRGLAAGRKSIPAKWLYDVSGSFLFDQICELPEYYPYRTETRLLHEAAPALSATIAPGAALMELGSGASRKTRILLDALPSLAGYVPVDINPDEVARAAAQIGVAYPGLPVTQVVADFTNPDALAALERDGPLLAFFPGSTLGNLLYPEAVALLATIRRAVGDGGRLLLGIDLLKDAATLIRAYDDTAGITAAFNLNLLDRMNRELAGDIDVGAFVHRAVWNATAHRIEMHLVARRALSFRIGSTEFQMRKDESIHTENSHKWSPAELERMFDAAGWRCGARWQADHPAYLLALLDA